MNSQQNAVASRKLSSSGILLLIFFPKKVYEGSFEIRNLPNFLQHCVFGSTKVLYLVCFFFSKFQIFDRCVLAVRFGVKERVRFGNFV